jgi:hypothetical protein
LFFPAVILGSFYGVKFDTTVILGAACLSAFGAALMWGRPFPLGWVDAIVSRFTKRSD